MDEIKRVAKQPGVETIVEKYSLTVIHAFGQYRRGDVIADADAIVSILDGENAPCVVKTL